MIGGDLVSGMVKDAFGRNGQISRKIAYICIIAIAVVLLQNAFQKYIFHCPEKGHKRFSLIFFFAPAVPLLVIGWLSNEDFQNSIRGVCYRFWNRKHRRNIWKQVNWRFVAATILSSYTNALVAPFCWFVMCLLNKKIMTCYTFGPRPLNQSALVQKQYSDLETYSQLQGFNVLLIAVAVASFLVAVKQCCKKYHPGKVIPELEVLDDYASYEANAAREHLQKLMKRRAEENGRKKVEMLIEAQQPDLSKLDGLECELEAMSYDTFVAAHNSLMNIYPRLYNNYDCRFQLHTIDGWHKEMKSFENELQRIKEIDNYRLKINGNIQQKKKQNKKKKKEREDENTNDATTTMGDEERTHLLDVQVEEKNRNYCGT